jgi:hypothetical protein
MHISLKQEGARRMKLTRAERQNWGTTGPVDNVPSDAPMGGNRKCTEQGVPVTKLLSRYAEKQ